MQRSNGGEPAPLERGFGQSGWETSKPSDADNVKELVKPEAIVISHTDQHGRLMVAYQNTTDANIPPLLQSGRTGGILVTVSRTRPTKGRHLSSPTARETTRGRIALHTVPFDLAEIGEGPCPWMERQGFCHPCQAHSVKPAGKAALQEGKGGFAEQGGGGWE